jgi:hypothetical protein
MTTDFRPAQCRIERDYQTSNVPPVGWVAWVTSDSDFFSANSMKKNYQIRAGVLKTNPPNQPKSPADATDWPVNGNVSYGIRNFTTSVIQPFHIADERSPFDPLQSLGQYLDVVIERAMRRSDLPSGLVFRTSGVTTGLPSAAFPEPACHRACHALTDLSSPAAHWSSSFANFGSRDLSIPSNCRI